MDPVIYSASVFQAFLTPIGTILFLFGIALVGLAVAILRTSDRPLNRIVLGLAGAFLLVVGCVMSFLTYRTITTGSVVVSARLHDKTVARDNCGDNSTCTRFVLEMTVGAKSLDLNISKDAFDKAVIGSCYQVAYYPPNGLFSDPAVSASYESVSNIRRVETTNSSACSQ